MADRDNSPRLDRRTFVVRSGLLALGTLGASLLEACAPAAPATPAAGSGGTSSAGGGAVKLPTYVPFEGPKPDLPGNEKGLDPAFFKFPTDLVKSVPTPPGDGSTVTAITYLTHYTNYTWRSGVIDNRIYAIPIARPPIGPVMMYRADLLEKAGVQIDKAPTNADDFKRILQAVTRPQDNQWGIAAGQASYFSLTPNNALSAIVRLPSHWQHGH